MCKELKNIKYDNPKKSFTFTCTQWILLLKKCQIL